VVLVCYAGVSILREGGVPLQEQRGRKGGGRGFVNDQPRRRNRITR